MTKFPRKVCRCCKVKRVIWKMYPMHNGRSLEIWVCQKCALAIIEQLNRLKVKESPSMKFRVALAKEKMKIYKGNKGFSPKDLTKMFI